MAMSIGSDPQVSFELRQMSRSLTVHEGEIRIGYARGTMGAEAASEWRGSLTQLHEDLETLRKFKALLELPAVREALLGTGDAKTRGKKR